MRWPDSGALEQAEDRRDNYGVMSRLFRSEVSRDLLAGLCESPAPDPTGNVLFDEGYGRIRAYLDSVEDVDKGRSELAQDYCYTFLGYGGGGPQCDGGSASMRAAYPYESIYASGSKAIGGEHSAQVREAYVEARFRPRRDRIDADDHIACELEFMQFLADQELTALRAADERAVDEVRMREKGFIEAHLLPWVSAFRRVVEDFAQTAFYQGLVQMTVGWLQQDAEYLASLSVGVE